MAADAVQTNKWANRATSTANAILLVAICYLLVRILFFFLNDQIATQPPKLSKGIPSQGLSTQSQGPQVDPSSIPLWNLLGKEGLRQETAPVKKTDEEVKVKTTLPLVLESVFVSSTEDNSTAIISEKRKPGELYHIGDKVPGNATLAAVKHDRVLLNRRGKLEALLFAKAGGGFVQGKKRQDIDTRSALAKAREERRKKEAARRRQKTGGIGKMIRGSRIPEPNEIAAVLSAELGADAAGALAEMGLEQNNGRGYKIGSSGSPLFSAVGGRPGDVVLSVNGQPLGNPTSDAEALTNMMANPPEKIVLDLERNGRGFSAEFAIPDL